MPIGGSIVRRLSRRRSRSHSVSDLKKAIDKDDISDLQTMLSSKRVNKDELLLYAVKGHKSEAVKLLLTHNISCEKKTSALECALNDIVAFYGLTLKPPRHLVNKTTKRQHVEMRRRFKELEILLEGGATIHFPELWTASVLRKLECKGAECDCPLYDQYMSITLAEKGDVDTIGLDLFNLNFCTTHTLCLPSFKKDFTDVLLMRGLNLSRYFRMYFRDAVGNHQGACRSGYHLYFKSKLWWGDTLQRSGLIAIAEKILTLLQACNTDDISFLFQYMWKSIQYPHDMDEKCIQLFCDVTNVLHHSGLPGPPMLYNRKHFFCPAQDSAGLSLNCSVPCRQYHHMRRVQGHQVKTLKDACRLVTRRNCYGPNVLYCVSRLELPQTLKNFLVSL